MTTNSSQVTKHVVDGKKLPNLKYVPDNQKCPYIISEVACELLRGGFNFKITHSTLQNVEKVNHVEAMICVDNLAKAVCTFNQDYIVGKPNGNVVSVKVNAATLTLFQWGGTNGVTLDNSIECISMPMHDGDVPNADSKPVQIPAVSKPDNSRRHHLGLTKLKSADCPPMYAHRIIDRYDIKRQVKMLMQAFLDYHNMHSLPSYRSLSQNDQQQLSLHGITPIEVVGGKLAWEREIINTGISFKDIIKGAFVDGRVAKYKLSVMHVNVDGRNFAVCVSKRKIRGVKKSTYILNIFELLTDAVEPYSGTDEVAKYIYSHLINS